MITAENIKFLDERLKELSMRDFHAAWNKGLMKGKFGHRSYTLSAETKECREMLHLALQRDTISKEDLERVKGYILKHKLLG